MNLRLENAISRIADEARGRYRETVSGARQRTARAAGRVAGGKRPVKTVSRFGLKLSAVTHRTADKVWKQQTRMVEHQIDAFAGRLNAAAHATDLRDLVTTQVRLIPQNVSTLAGDARDTLSIVAGAGGELRELLRGMVEELRGRKPAAKPKTRRKAPVAKKTAKKTRKKAAKKVAASAA